MIAYILIGTCIFLLTMILRKLYKKMSCIYAFLKLPNTNTPTINLKTFNDDIAPVSICVIKMAIDNMKNCDYMEENVEYIVKNISIISHCFVNLLPSDKSLYLYPNIVECLQLCRKYSSMLEMKFKDDETFKLAISAIKLVNKDNESQDVIGEYFIQNFSQNECENTTDSDDTDSSEEESEEESEDGDDTEGSETESEEEENKGEESEDGDDTEGSETESEEEESKEENKSEVYEILPEEEIDIIELVHI